MKGVTKYQNRYRAAWSNRDGVNKVKYFPTEAEAEAHYKRMTDNGKRKVCRVNKRHDCNDKMLPIGLCLCHDNSGGYSYKIITTTIRINGKAMSFGRSFGKCRTKAEAIRIVKAWRDEFLKEKAEAENKRWIK